MRGSNDKNLGIQDNMIQLVKYMAWFTAIFWLEVTYVLIDSFSLRRMNVFRRKSRNKERSNNMHQLEDIFSTFIGKMLTDNLPKFREAWMNSQENTYQPFHPVQLPHQDHYNYRNRGETSERAPYEYSNPPNCCNRGREFPERCLG